MRHASIKAAGMLIWPAMQYFNIQVASQLSGVATATIRAWEKRYNAVVPERAENKHRLYSEKDIEKLALLYELTEFGQSIGKIAHLELDFLKDVYSKLFHKPYDERQLVTPNHAKVDFEKIQNNFMLALAVYKIDIISHELEKAVSLMNPRDLALKVLVPLFQEIGKKVENHELSIAQEHTLSAIVSFYLGQVIGSHYQKKIARDDLILITTPEGELHEIGILLTALLCVHHGHKFIYLGGNLPAASLVEAANALKCKTIILGVTKGHQLTEKLTINDYISELQSKLNGNKQILVGGNLRPTSRLELEKKSISFFPSLSAMDDFLSKN